VTATLKLTKHWKCQTRRHKTSVHGLEGSGTG